MIKTYTKSCANRVNYHHHVENKLCFCCQHAKCLSSAVDSSHLPFEKCAIRLQAQKLPVIQTQSFESWHFQGWTLSHMAKWSNSIFTWEMQAKDSCSRDHHWASSMLNALLEPVWRAKQTWQPNTEPKDKSSTLREIPTAFSPLIRKPGQVQIHPHCISFSVFTIETPRGWSLWHAPQRISDSHVFAGSKRELPEYRCSSLQDFPQLFLTSAFHPLHPWRDLHLYMLNAGCLATTSLLNLQMVCWQYPGGSAVRGEGLPRPQYYDVMYKPRCILNRLH